MLLKTHNRNLRTKRALAGLAFISLFLLGLFLLPKEIKAPTTPLDEFLDNRAVKAMDTVSVIASNHSYFSKKEFYEEAYSVLPDITGPTSRPLAGIVPHHLLVKPWLAAYFDKLRPYEYKTVIIIAPNHYSFGKVPIMAIDGAWETPYGTLEADSALLASFTLEAKLSASSTDFGFEHGLSGIMPFIKKTWPEAKIAPFIIRADASANDIKAFSEALAGKVPSDALVLASVDFSHYQGQAVADFHDEHSQNILSSVLDSRAAKLEVDSPLSLEVLMSYAASRGSFTATLAAHTNSSALLKQPDEPGTSHNFYYFSSGERKLSEKTPVSFLFFGDLMLARHVQEKYQKEGGIDYLFDKLKGGENRFFSGTDFVVANLEGAITDGGKYYPPQNAYDFAFLPDDIGKLKRYGFNFFGLANNHFSDQGERGVKETRANLERLGFGFSGATDARVEPVSLSYQVLHGTDKKIAFIGLSSVYHQFDLEAAKGLIVEAKKGSSLVVINVHWGVEYKHDFSNSQKSVGHALVDAGADLIIGHHPHVVEGMEIYKGKAIFYSLGNFVFDQYFSDDTQEGLAVGANFDGINWSLHLFPLISKVSQPRLMIGKEKIDFLERFIGWSELEEKDALNVRKNGVLRLEP